MKKALHLLNSFKRGGAENVALNYSIALNKLGIRSTFIANHKSIDYENMLREKGGEIVYKLNHDLINGADIIFIHSNINLLRLVIYKILGKLRNKKVLYIQHLAYSGSKFKLLSLLINWICTDFILITPRTRQLVNNYIKIHIEEIINFYINKYDQESYNKIRNTVRNELSIEAGTKLLMFSAIFKPGKGLDECLRLASCFINNPEIKFLIVGDGEEKYLLDKYPYDNLIAIGIVNDVERYLIASDAYLFLSSLPEMLPMALVEAINIDIPIIAYKTSINDFLLNGNTCTSFDNIIKRINAWDIPAGFQHYDQHYATEMLKKLLEK